MGKNYQKKLALLAKQQGGNVVDSCTARSINPEAEQKAAIILQHKILRIITEKEAGELRPSKKESIGVITVVPRIYENEIQVLTVTENNSFNKGYTFMKLPSFTMKARDENLSDCLHREGVSELDRNIGDFIFVCGAEFESSIPGERHHKLCFIAKEFGKFPVSGKIISKAEEIKIKLKSKATLFVEGGHDLILKKPKRKNPRIYTPSEPDIISVQWVEIREAFKKIPKSQKIMVQPIVEKLRKLSFEFWNSTPMVTPELTFMEGTFGTSIFQPK